MTDLNRIAPTKRNELGGIFSYHGWKDYAIKLFCSNIKCKNILIIDERKVYGLIYCTDKCFRRGVFA